jgi:hypothetical protein
MYSFWTRRLVRPLKERDIPCRTRSDLLAKVFWHVPQTKSRVNGTGGAPGGRPLGSVEGESTLQAGSSVEACPVVDKTGAEAVDLGEAGAELDLSDSNSEGGLFSPAASLLSIFLMSMHSLRPLQAGAPPPSAQHQFAFVKG